MSVAHTIKHQMPDYFTEQYPALVEFLETYYKWMESDGHQSPEEFAGVGASTEQELHESNLIARPLAAQENLQRDYYLERAFNGLMAQDGTYFEGSDEHIIEASTRNEDFVVAWYERMGFPYVKNNIHLGAEVILDHARLIKLVKHLKSIRGTSAGVVAFFKIFFGETATVVLPRLRIGLIDDNAIPDSLNVMRDDEYYNEYTYVVRTAEDPSKYSYLVESVYRPQFHPSGFNLILEQQ